MIILSVFLVLAWQLKTRDSFVILIAMLSVFAYSISPEWEIHPAWANHTIYSVMLIPSLWFLTKPVCVAILGYISFHWLIAGHFIFLPQYYDSGLPLYLFASAGVDALIMVSLFHGASRGKTLFNFDLAPSWLPNRVHDLFSSKKAGQ